MAIFLCSLTRGDAGAAMRYSQPRSSETDGRLAQQSALGYYTLLLVP